MTNLIPPDAHVQVKREYWIRVFSVWMVLVGSAALIVGVFTTPVFMLIQNQLSSYQTQYVAASEDRATFDELEGKIDNAMNMSKAILNTENRIQFTTVMQSLHTIAGDGIEITKIELQRNETAVTSILVSGEASSRLLLASFVKRLQATPEFSYAQLPLSNLAKDKDVPFTITIAKPKEEKKK